MNNSTTDFNEFLVSIDEELGRDNDSLHLFEWVIEDRYESILTLNMDLFVDSPELMKEHNEQILTELDTLLNYFEETEEYEKCSRLVNIIKEFKGMLSRI
ncbi:MAG: hypothetical protein ACFFKA_00150 [Candidatus Thorarchaeota archaeon]